MPKFWSYPEGLKVIINENAKNACPHHVGREGKIIELLHLLHMITQSVMKQVILHSSRSMN